MGLKNYPSAISYYKEAIDIIEKMREGVKGIGEEMATAFMESKSFVYEEYIKLLIEFYLQEGKKDEERLKEAFRTLERRKVRMLLERMEMREKEGFIKSEEGKRNLAEIKRLEQERIRLIKDKKLEEAKNTEKRINELYNEILKIEPLYRELVSPRISSVDDVCRFIDDKSVFIEYGVFSDRVYAFYIRKDDRCRIDFAELDIKPLEAALFVIDVQGTFSQREMANLDDVKKLMRKGYEVFIKPLNIEKKSRLIISPDSYLYFIPFEAFMNENRFLIEDYEVSYIPSGSLFVKLNERRGKEVEFDIVAFANIDYGKVKEKGGSKEILKDRECKMLPSGERELKKVKELFKSRRIFEKDKGKKENCLKECGKGKILFLSTHGVYDVSIEGDPLSKSGIFFAGCNEPDKDSFLSAIEVMGMDMNGVDVVILSACETGLGEIKAGEGVYGLQRAFLMAGAGSLILTLWSVGDKDAEFIDKSILEGIKNGEPIPSALRNAKINMIREKRKKALFPNPYNWSGFVYVGK
jgi:CHAT domain-containing protein